MSSFFVLVVVSVPYITYMKWGVCPLHYIHGMGCGGVVGWGWVGVVVGKSVFQCLHDNIDILLS